MRETGTDEVLAAMAAPIALVSARHGFVETGRGIRAAGVPDTAFRALWLEMLVIDVDQPLCERAFELTSAHPLRTLDALHLAAALQLGRQATFATWDRRLWDAAQAEGLTLLPTERP